MKSLSIPNRDRLKGQTIICWRCESKGFCSTKTPKGKTKWVCKSSGKLLGSCKTPESHRYASTIYNPFTQKSDIIIRHETRDFWEFRKRHNELLDIEKEIKYLYKSGNVEQAMEMVKSFKKTPKQEIKEIPSLAPEKIKEAEMTSDTYLETAMITYADYLDGKIGHEWEKRPNSKQTIGNYKRALERFHETLVKNGYNPEILALSALRKDHLNCWVTEVKQRYEATKTQNHYLNDISTFLGWCTKRGAGSICNTLDFVKRSKTEGDTTIAEIQDFVKMIQLITPTNGKGYENWKDGKTGKTIRKSKNYYRDWLTDGYWLSLLLGGRGDDITDLRWNEVRSKIDIDGNTQYWIELNDHKFERSQGVKRTTHTPIYKQTYEVLLRMGLKEKMGTEEFVLAPEEIKRENMKRVMGNSFRWYWREVAKLNPKVKYKSLRSTFVTLATNLAGDQFKMVQKHTQSDTARKHYYDKSVAVSNMFGQDFYGLKIA